MMDFIPLLEVIIFTVTIIVGLYVISFVLEGLNKFYIKLKKFFKKKSIKAFFRMNFMEDVSKFVLFVMIALPILSVIFDVLSGKVTDTLGEFWDYMQITVVVIAFLTLLEVVNAVVVEGIALGEEIRKVRWSPW